MKIPWAQTIVGTIAFGLQAVHIYILLLWKISKSTQSTTRGLFKTLLSCPYPEICKVWSLICINVVFESHNIFSISSTLIIVENPELIH